MSGYVDVHQHLWPPPLLEALRRRSSPPMLRGWTLHTAGEAPFAVDPAAHDVRLRRAQDQGAAAVLVSLSAPLGIEHLPPDEARPLLDAWHEGVCALGAPFRGWASVGVVEPGAETGELARLLTSDAAGAAAGHAADAAPRDTASSDAPPGDATHAAPGDGSLVGVQLPATALTTPGGWERLEPVLELCARLDRPVLVHPGPARPDGDRAGVPSWWPAVVDYPAQLQAAWWAAKAWRGSVGSAPAGPRICFVAGAGLAPVGHERFTARSGLPVTVDRDVFVDTSSYGRQGIDALIRALGIDVVVHGSDRPYAHPRALPDRCPDLGAAALHAITTTNPVRLLKGETP